MHPKISGFKLNAFRRKWAGLLVAVCAATVIAFAIAPLLTQANLLNAPVEEMTVTFTEGTNMAAAPSPDGKTIILAIQGSLWSIPSSGGGAALTVARPEHPSHDTLSAETTQK